MTYYNTNGETGAKLEQSQGTAATQENVIQSLFSNGEELTPSEVLDRCNASGYKYLITSVRRAMTNLTNKGILVKNTTLKDGAYGKQTHTWSLGHAL